MFARLKPQKKSATDDPGLSLAGVSTQGFLGSAKTAIGFIPIVGSAVNTVLDEGKKIKDNEDAKGELIMEIKYSILLIESSNNLIRYITEKKLIERLCDHNILSDMTGLITKITKMLKDLRKDDNIKFKTNKEIEKIVISEFTENLPNHLSPEERARAVLEKKQELYSNIFERCLADEDAIDIIKQVEQVDAILKIGPILLNEGRGTERLFYIDEKGNKIYLKLENFLEQSGFSTFLDKKKKKSLDDLYRSNVAKFLRNTYQMDQFIWEKNNEFEEFSYQGNTHEETKIVFILNQFLELFMQTFEYEDAMYKKLQDLQTFLFKLDSYSFQVLMQVFNDPIYVKNTRDRMLANLECISSGRCIKQTRFDPNEFFSKIIIVSDFVNFRINLNVVATQLNSLYQDLLFQVFQLKTMDPIEEKLLCPTFSMRMFR